MKLRQAQLEVVRFDLPIGRAARVAWRGTACKHNAIVAHRSASDRCRFGAAHTLSRANRVDVVLCIELGSIEGFEDLSTKSGAGLVRHRRSATRSRIETNGACSVVSVDDVMCTPSSQSGDHDKRAQNAFERIASVPGTS